MTDLERVIIGFAGLTLFTLSICGALISAGTGRTWLGLASLGALFLGSFLALYATLG